MASNPFQVVRDFESALCEHTGAKYAVTVTSCTAALMLAVAWHLKVAMVHKVGLPDTRIWIPKHTYVSVPMSIIHGGGIPQFDNRTWLGEYQLAPLLIWDSARWFRRDMYRPGQFMCLSFHWTKQLAIGQGGAILHDDPEADAWLRRARFDGRKEGMVPKDDMFSFVGHHCYMSPRDAAEGLSRLAVLKDSGPLPNDDYPDLSTFEVFK